MQVIPSLDLRAGRVVRLLHGDFARQTAYAGDAMALASTYAEAGATRLHVVDLDAARGEAGNRALIERLVAGAGLEVQVAGGVRSRDDAARWLGAGAAAAVMGTTAVRDPEVLAAVAGEFPGRVLAALDVRAGRPAVSGWSASVNRTVADMLGAWAGALLGGVILTSIDRDGTLAGPDLAVLAEADAATRHPLTYSGGIGSLEHLEAVAEAGAAAVILGKSLLEGRFQIAEALSRHGLD